MNENFVNENFPMIGLRDYFAARALAALTNSDVKWNVNEIAIAAYRIADAMLEARKHQHTVIEEGP